MLPLTDTIRARSFPVVNWLLILTNLFVFVAIELPLPRGNLEAFVTTWGLVPTRFWAGDSGALLALGTHMFLHGGWLHLISNMWALFIFGDNVEDRLGSIRYLVFYLACGLAAALAQAAISREADIPMVGASGALAGVLAAYLVSFPRSRVITLIPIFIFPWFVEIPAVFYLVFWFISQLFSGVLAVTSRAMMGGVAYWAHIGGFLAGLLLVPIFGPRRRAVRQWWPDEYHPY